MKNKEKKSLGLYIHIPFCIKKCNYCDFLSMPSTKEVKQQYVEALVKEIKGRKEENTGCIVFSIFFGGGTPSLLTEEQLEKILGAIRENYEVARDAEISMEMNPGTVNKEKLEAFYKAGINRISFGLQSADSRELKLLGRIHDYDTFERCYHEARAVGFDNINVDLMSGLPGQNKESYAGTLKKVLALQPEHISAYSLIIEEGTPLSRWVQEGKVSLLEEEQDRELYEMTGSILGAQGYERYEISNYAKRGKECRHNIRYWTRGDYLGFGIGSASLREEKRFQNGTDLSCYLKDPLLQREEIRELSQKEQMEEFMFLGLRMTRGISLKEFENQFQRKAQDIYKKVFEKHRNDGLMAENITQEDVFWHLTPLGINVSNYVMADFLL